MPANEDDRRHARVWLVTDVPFWEQANGSHQRIAGLARALTDANYDLTLWHIGSIPARARKQLERIGRWSAWTGPQCPPRALGSRLAWQVAGSLHGLRQLASFPPHRKLKEPPPDATAPPRRLADYQVPPIARRLLADVRAEKPDVLLIEYVTLSYLAAAIRSELGSQRPRLICDTHDVMHRRGKSFHAAGQPHWLQVDAEEEAAALASFDTLIAIQPNEAAELQRLVPQRRVITCGHPVWVAPDFQLTGQEQSGSALRIGFLAGAGAANRHGWECFVKGPWQRLRQRWGQRLECHVAGGLADELAAEGPGEVAPGVVLRGRLAELGDWYRELAVAINPATMGAGLKIKSVEALAHGCPLVTTTIGLEGITAGPQEGAFAAAGVDAMEQPLNELLADPQTRIAAARAASAYIRNNCHPTRVCRELILECDPEQHSANQ